jgi:hypothetical protein
MLDVHFQKYSWLGAGMIDRRQSWEKAATGRVEDANDNAFVDLKGLFAGVV